MSYQTYNGFIDSAAVKGRYGIAPMAPTVLAMGRMTAQKGMDMLVEAVPMVLAWYPETKFILVGGGPDKGAIVRRAHEVGAAHAIVFLEIAVAAGMHRLEACRRHRRRAEPQRAVRIVVLEAWAAGKPVVATLGGGPREFIWHDVNGFLVDTNPGGLARLAARRSRALPRARRERPARGRRQISLG